LPARQHHRHGDYPGQDAAKERDHELDAGRTQQQCALAGCGPRGEPPGQRRGAPLEFGLGLRRNRAFGSASAN